MKKDEGALGALAAYEDDSDGDGDEVQNGIPEVSGAGKDGSAGGSGAPEEGGQGASS
jgi:hypothetical protein